MTNMFADTVQQFNTSVLRSRLSSCSQTNEKAHKDIFQLTPPKSTGSCVRTLKDCIIRTSQNDFSSPRFAHYLPFCVRLIYRTERTSSVCHFKPPKRRVFMKCCNQA